MDRMNLNLKYLGKFLGENIYLECNNERKTEIARNIFNQMIEAENKKRKSQTI